MAVSYFYGFLMESVRMRSYAPAHGEVRWKQAAVNSSQTLSPVPLTFLTSEVALEELRARKSLI